MKNHIKVVSDSIRIAFVLAALKVLFPVALALSDLSVHWYQCGRDLNHNHGYYKEAIQCYDLAIKSRPDFAEAYYNKGLALRSLGHIPEADEAFTKAKELGYAG